jgi:hypothetical protein
MEAKLIYIASTCLDEHMESEIQAIETIAHDIGYATSSILERTTFRESFNILLGSHLLLAYPYRSNTLCAYETGFASAREMPVITYCVEEIDPIYRLCSIYIASTFDMLKEALTKLFPVLLDITSEDYIKVVEELKKSIVFPKD